MPTWRSGNVSQWREIEWVDPNFVGGIGKEGRDKRDDSE